MTHSELAALIGTHDYKDKFTPYVTNLAMKNGLVIVTAIGDDVVKFHGAIRDEADCMRGGNMFLQKEGLETLVFKKQNDANTRLRLQAIWEKHRIYLWKFRLSIPHSKFTVMRDDKKWCEAIIFSTKELACHSGS